MYLNQNSLQYKHYQDFEKYAKFICENFDISVQLESTRAETDGKTIFLPNVLSMTSKELDMMYAILLHEAGHIRYSTFDESYFSQLKTKAHAFLANSIEDARIENLLIKDFGGAIQMFESFYCDYTQDKVLMKKVFKHDGEKPDLFAALAFHVHNEIIECRTSTLKEIAGTRIASKINKFWKQYNIASLIENINLKGDKEVLELTNKIYDLFISAFKAKDTSEALSFTKKVKEKNEIEKKLDDLKAEAQKVEEKVKELNEKSSKIAQDLIDFDIKHEKEFSENQEKVENLSVQIKQSQDKIQWKKEFDANNKAVNELPSKISSLESDLQKQINEKTRLEQMLEKGLTGRGKEMTAEQKESNKNKIESKKRQIEKLTQRLKNHQGELQMKKEALEQAMDQTNQNPFRFDKNLDIEATKEKVTELQQKLEEINNAISELTAERNKMISEQNAVESEIDKVQSDFMEKAATSMFNVDKKGRGSDFDLDIMPELHYQDSWPEAAQAQEDFDEKASKSTGKMVRNGQKAAGMFGTNVRDIITFIDKKKERVAEIDVVEIFKGKIGISKLDDFNSDVKQMNYMEDKSVIGVFGTHREHIPSTTVFDNIKKENISQKKQEFNDLMKENAIFYRDLKRVFARKFKFAKKDFWKGGQEEGSFDARNLWKLPTNQGNDFYEIVNPKYVNKMAASILVDLSGSQNKEATEYGKKIRALVLGLSQALDEVHIKHEVLGYHAPVCDEMRQMNSSSIYTRRSNRLETIVFKEAGQKDQMGVMNIEPQMTDNSDGESLRIALKRLKAMRAKSHMIFIISDGKPFLCDTDVSVLDEDFRSALRQAVREKVQVVGLGFFNQLSHFLGERFCNASKNEDILKFFDITKFQ